MNAREWKPGELATLVTVNGPGGRAVRRGGVWMFLDREGYAIDPYVTDARPLVAIDPENRAQVERLVVAHCRAYCCDPAPLQPEEVAIMQDALREFANPKPAEPTALGAVVEDEDGARWTRARNQEHGLNWRAEWGGQWKPFTDIDAVRVLSEGVTQ